ncbi:MAG TPA: HAD family phosphatase [Caulobacteraceae bacterium]|jgi:HAD superfamily hydrolase (TIGR01509 family)|nr:HAD family phosphatase [Caulobacteraceae bacterium]
MQGLIFPRPVRAVIFDMDGLLVDTEVPVRDALMNAAAGIGRELPATVFLSMVGTTSAHSDAILVEHFGEGFDLAAFQAEVWRLLETRFDLGVPLKPGALELLALVDQIGLPKALVTSSSRRAVDRHLPAEVVARFAHLVTRESVERGKPHPEPYLKAAAALGIAPRDCLALEDSHNGVRSAHAAGMMAVMVPDLLEATDEMREKTIAIAQSLHDVRLALT